jgi:PBP1b-binding outer membrane lipoprotein LpoB
MKSILFSILAVILFLAGCAFVLEGNMAGAL